MTVANATLSKSAPSAASTAGRTAPSRRWLGLAVVLAGALMAIMDAFIVNISLPDIRAGLHATFAQAQLVIAGYGLSYAAALITGSRLGDLFGRRRIFVIGLGGFTAASLACGLAPTPHALIGARLLQGLAAAAMFPQVLSLMRVTFTDAGERATAFALLGATQGLGSIAGQIGGGLLVGADLWGLGWRPIFLVNVPVGLVVMLAASRLIGESTAPGARRLDLAGAILSALALALLLYPLIEGRESGWPPWSLAMLGVSIPTLFVFVRHQHVKSVAGGSPLMDTRLFRNGGFVVGIAAVLVLCTILISFFVVLAFVLQAGLGLTPLAAATAFLPLALAYVLASFIAGRLGPQRSHAVLLVGGIGLTLGYAVMASIALFSGAHLTGIALVPPLILVGVSQGLLFTPLLNVILSTVPAGDVGIASGIVSTTQQAGGALGVAIVGLLFFGTLQAGGAGGTVAYADAFFNSLLYDIGAAGLTTLLLVFLQHKRVESPV
jgi:EmrB/QacA subfamily drug resistance transporter